MYLLYLLVAILLQQSNFHSSICLFIHFFTYISIDSGVWFHSRSCNSSPTILFLMLKLFPTMSGWFLDAFDMSPSFFDTGPHFLQQQRVHLVLFLPRARNQSFLLSFGFSFDLIRSHSCCHSVFQPSPHCRPPQLPVKSGQPPHCSAHAQH